LINQSFSSCSLTDYKRWDFADGIEQVDTKKVKWAGKLKIHVGSGAEAVAI